MKKVLLSLSLLAALMHGGRAHAEVGTPDPVRASTLLLPYFEVDLSDPAGNGINTLVTVQNSSATAILVHVTFWTDVGVPTLRENVYLTGYDIQTLDLRQYFVRGRQVVTASVGQDPNPGLISPQGLLSQDINFASCGGQLPVPRTLTQFELENFQQMHTGRTVRAFDRCTAQQFGDNIARGYITFDTVNNCTQRSPSDIAYFVSGGLGDATNQNVLFGEYLMINRSTGFAVRDRLAAIDSNATNQETSIPGEYTFYGRYVADTAADNREHLPTTWATRYDSRPGRETDVVVWRDSKSAAQGSFLCTAKPTWYPLEATQIVAFDEEENPSVVAEAPEGVFPAQANRARIGGTSLPVPFDSGWLYLNLSHISPGLNPPENPTLASSHVTSIGDGPGAADSASTGTSLDRGDDEPPVIIPVP